MCVEAYGTTYLTELKRRLRGREVEKKLYRSFSVRWNCKWWRSTNTSWTVIVSYEISKKINAILRKKDFICCWIDVMVSYQLYKSQLTLFVLRRQSRQEDGSLELFADHHIVQHCNRSTLEYLWELYLSLYPGWDKAFRARMWTLLQWKRGVGLNGWSTIRELKHLEKVDTWL